jgi:hypothetical protein
LIAFASAAPHGLVAPVELPLVRASKKHKPGDLRGFRESG